MCCTCRIRRKGSYFASVTQLNMDGETSYHGGLFSLQKRFSSHYSVSGNYTISRCMNDQDPQQFLSSVFSQPGNIDADRGPCAGDRLHVFNATAVVSTPDFDHPVVRAIASGWQWSTIYQASSGAPMNVTIGRDNALTGAPNQRPNLVGEWKLDEPTAAQWFNTAAFALPAPGTYGNLSRNELRGPGTWNVDTVLARSSPSPKVIRSSCAPRRSTCSTSCAPASPGRPCWHSQHRIHQHAVRPRHFRGRSAYPAVRREIRVLVSFKRRST